MLVSALLLLEVVTGFRADFGTSLIRNSRCPRNMICKDTQAFCKELEEASNGAGSLKCLGETLT